MTSRVLILEPINSGWIIEKLMRDIAAELVTRGLPVRIGAPDSYAGEEIVLHSRAYYAKMAPDAKINSIFFTHVDDLLKEREVKTLFDDADSFICLSPMQKSQLVDMGLSEDKAIGIELPARSPKVRCVKVGMFSARYPDGRKNEDWILEAVKKMTVRQRQSIIFAFLGDGWESFCLKLKRLNASYEIVNLNRSMSGEYDYYQSKISDLDLIYYCGMDGGAMSIYDSFHANVPFLFPYNCYHVGLEENGKLFHSKSEFIAELIDLTASVLRKEELLMARSIKSYCDRLLLHWMSINPTLDLASSISNSPKTGPDSEQPIPPNQVPDLRSSYKKISIKRTASHLYRTYLRRD